MKFLINHNNTIREIKKVFINQNNTIRNITKGFIFSGGSAKQFFSLASSSYNFNFGNTLYIGTNGYISFDSGNSVDAITSTVGRVLGILPADLVQDSLQYAADGTYYYIYWKGHRYSGGTANEIQYEVWFPSGYNYAYIYLAAFPSSTYSSTAYYYNGSNSGYSRVTSSRTAGSKWKVYFGSTAATSVSFSPWTSTGSLWLTGPAITVGGTDVGYTTLITSQGTGPSQPTSLSVTSITGTTATLNWSTPSNNGMSPITKYEYRYSTSPTFNFDSVAWTNANLSTSVSLSGLTAGTTYYWQVRAYNYLMGVGSTADSANLGVTFNTTATPAPTNNTVPTLYGSLSVGSTVTFGVGTWNNFPTSYDLRLYRGTLAVSSSETLVKSAGNVTSSTYVIQQSDLDSGQLYLRAFASATNAGGSSGLVAGQEIGPIVAATVAPTISTSSISPSSGTAGSTTFTASATASGTPTPTLSYQWQYFSTSFSYVNISGATSSSYSPPYNFNTIYPNYGFYCLITASNGVGTPATARPSATLNSPPAGTAPSAPTVTGDNSITPHGGHFYWSSSSGSTPITYVFSIYDPSGALVYTTSGSAVSTTSFAVGTGYYTTAGNYQIYVYAHNAYGDSSVTIGTQYMS